MYVVVNAKFEIETVIDCPELAPDSKIGQIQAVAKEEAKAQLKQRLISNCKIIGEPIIGTMRITV